MCLRHHIIYITSILILDLYMVSLKLEQQQTSETIRNVVLFVYLFIFTTKIAEISATNCN